MLNRVDIGNRIRRAWPVLAVSAAVLIVAVVALFGTEDRPITVSIILPTGNDALYRGEDSAFYMRTARGGEEPWRSGMYGFVRSPRKTRDGLVHLRHHAGIDIRPLYRDGHGKPLDSVRAIADGIVVYTNDTAGQSNFGRYVVIEHRWGGSPYYSLYAHLDAIWVDSGAHVSQGTPIARLGYTGAGINRQRAHLHFEMNLMVSRAFDAWFTANYSKLQKNHHGIYNGLNMVALDASRLFVELHENPSKTLPEIIQESEGFYTVTVASTGPLDLVEQYPWLLSRPVTQDDHSWTITFTRDALPIKVEPSADVVKQPQVRMLSKSPLPYSWLTKGIVSGHADKASLSYNGERYLTLIMSR